MHKLALFIKSYDGHLEYTKQLVESIKQYNVDNIPTYLSVPENQLSKFKEHVDTDCLTIMTDEEIVSSLVVNNWYGQQLVKMSFSQLELCENYLWIDADSYFIRSFGLSDFMATDDTPYTNITECRDLLTWCAPRPERAHVFKSFAIAKQACSKTKRLLPTGISLNYIQKKFNISDIFDILTKILD